MKKMILSLSLAAFSPMLLAQTLQTTVTVKQLHGYGESGDAYSFTAQNGKRYMVYNAGGTQPIPGERYLLSSAKHKKPICLTLDQSSQPPLVNSVKQGTCR